ncbi:Coenzyme F420 hydrogenase/dehydrogenase, beta subunit C-terminal domain [Parapedobacter tibetensis]|uniref:Coenzyme F420 hydrogenase/dehydrogenase, beta subunit C-terminal domain n=1 Tax=Parapedobacter tibetensis TaxID=2972951 RepID=UPI00214D6FD7|nr:Coenzyme F420 hydrogenase/dehydrogenase, beta subunit C-terminal domain [Parapedobacter tibetensis]
MAGSVIQQIDNRGLCLGCGLCESVCGSEHVHIQLGLDGFFHPEVKHSIAHREAIIARICPGLNIVNDIPFGRNERIWGRIRLLLSGYATDSDVRDKGSSGGIVSAIAIHMLKTKQVNAVLQVGGDSSDFRRNSLQVSRTRDHVLHCASSRYAPALVFNNILELLDSSNDTFCFIGKPCDISALKNFLKEYPRYKERLKLTVAIMCAGMPSIKGTQAIIDDQEATPPITNLTYRGHGWPGYFTFTDSKQRHYQQSYNDSWGKTLNRYLHFRCKICPEGIGIQADIAVGDAWETKDGYPDFSEKEGWSLVLARTPAGETVLKMAQQAGNMVLQPLSADKIALMQPYQYNRRIRAGSRMLAFWIGTGKRLNFRKLQFFNASLLSDKIILLKDFWGTFRRVRSKMKKQTVGD